VSQNLSSRSAMTRSPDAVNSLAIQANDLH